MSDDELNFEPIPENTQKITHKTYLRVLTQMGNSVATREKIHVKRASKNNFFVKSISYPSMIFGGLIAFSGIAQFSRNSSNPECGSDLWLQIFTTIVGLTTMGLSITREFFKFDKKGLENGSAVENLRGFFYTVDTCRSLTKGLEGDRLDIINGLRKQYQTIIRQNPNIGDIAEKLELTAVKFPSSSEEPSSTDSEPESEPSREVSMKLETLYNESKKSGRFDEKIKRMGYMMDRLENV